MQPYSLPAIDLRVSAGSSHCISASSNSGKSHFFYSLVKNFNAYHRLPTNKITVFAAVPSKPEYQERLRAVVPASLCVQVRPLEDIVAYKFETLQELVLIDDLQPFYLKKPSIQEAFSTLLNITCHQQELYVYIILQSNLKDPQFWKLITTCGYLYVNPYLQSARRLTFHVFKQLQIGKVGPLQKLLHWYSTQQHDSHFVCIPLNPPVDSPASEIAKAKWIAGGHMPQLQLFLLELAQGFTCFVHFEEEDRSNQEKDNPRDITIVNTKPRLEKKVFEHIKTILASAHTMNDQFKNSLYVCVPVTHIANQKATLPASRQDASLEVDKDQALPKRSLEQQVKMRIEETFAPPRRFSLWRVASYI